ncbi:hypothetical protein [Erwinia phage Zoomie]|uniref:DNA maturase A n=1 Tax=Erwinia phage Zoomie TaxID=2851072 RepID=A0A9E6N9F3_9CAUD|nr:hypothetical protein [Erwinia phage Zoomie]
MSKQRAGSKSRLSALHAMFTEALINELKEAGAENIPLPAADKSVIAKFLKDNDITADADDESMNSLRDEFEDELAKKREERAKAIMQTAGGTGDDLSDMGII